MTINPDWYNEEPEENSVVTNFFRDFVSNIDDTFELFPNKFTFSDWMYIFGCDKTKASSFIDGLKKITTISIHESGVASFRNESKCLFTNEFAVDSRDLEDFGVEYYSEIEPTILGKFNFTIKDYANLTEYEEESWFKEKTWGFKDLIVNYIYEENRVVSVDEISSKFKLNPTEVFRFAFELDLFHLPIWKRMENGTISLFPISLLSEDDFKSLELNNESINSVKLSLNESKAIQLNSSAGVIVRFIENAGKKVSLELISKELGLDLFYLFRFIFTYHLWGHHIKMEVSGKDILLYKHRRKTRNTIV